ncbi:transcription-repair coupling factor [Candidatus Vallotia lariciata]|uniref:transcription-repair coupling factor n=1 Tax=Candidatus Vallotia laricis TaxID=2018052 RepID=UPI001D01DA7F|nr:transcription-repair coupling factor [Candidatus Vallotia lariciata]UDG83022.1 Transcription-repair-coupling factor [Candidatus Vallotia lariciata]
MPHYSAASRDSRFSCPFSFPKEGQRYVFNGALKSADALAITRYYLSNRDRMPMIALICASAVDAQRLQQEISYFLPSVRVRLFPDWETLPYDTFSPHQDLISERLATLFDLGEGRCEILIVPAVTALYRMPPTTFIATHTFDLKQGQQLDEAKLRARLLLSGYEHVTQVVHPGEYSVRGSLIDLFPMGSSLPYRIDLVDDQVDSIRAFNPDTQRSLYPVCNVLLLPGREFSFDETARTEFRSRWRAEFDGNPSRVAIYRDVGNGVASAGIEYYLPLFFEDTSTLLHYFPKNTHLVLVGNIEESIRQFIIETKERYAFLSHNHDRPVLSPARLFLSEQDFFGLIRPFARILLAYKPLDNDAECWSIPLPSLAMDRRSHDALNALRRYLSTTDQRVLLFAESAGRRETIAQLLADHHLQASLFDSFDEFIQSDALFGLAVAPIASGFILPKEHIALVTETELYGPLARRTGYHRRYARSTRNIDLIVRDLSELKVGDPIVHIQYGIGRYMGLIPMDIGEGNTELLHLEYHGESRLYVPVSQLHVISRYSAADPDKVPLQVLGSGQWEKTRRRAAQHLRDTAAELLYLYARRSARKRCAFAIDRSEYMRFSEGFGFNETPDQASAISAVINDMTSGQPMDRLICGDVGFGKTEVALRAAFIAALNGKQVAFLSPTTLLAEQHFQTFTDRFAGWPIRIAELSRFQSPREVNTTIQALNNGNVDIVIGTQRLLSTDVRFKRLALVIIDEEHRFGVQQKEALKSLCEEVDVLTLTATPIPRTLGMALEGLRDFSIISTAPQKRLAIKTFVQREEDSVIREAMLRELKRGGQVYFLHNEVESIDRRRTALEILAPGARIAVAHGQMNERELECVMRDFISQRVNVLLCTTIIETGIDVPNANTILIHRADKFGLAQLHQLRGRVGRFYHQAYAYLLLHDPQSLTWQAQRRLEAIRKMEELGSGFRLAIHDLEIRGTGEILGEKQSGDIKEIGFQLYTNMLNNAVCALKDGRELDLNSPLAETTEINLHIPAILPSEYCGDIPQRLSIYKRLANCETAGAIDSIHEELIDRFGKLPIQAQALMETHRLRLVAKQLGILKIDASEDMIYLQFTKNPAIDPGRIVEMMRKYSYIKLAGQDKLRIDLHSSNLASRVKIIMETMRALSTLCKHCSNR